MARTDTKQTYAPEKKERKKLVSVDMQLTIITSPSPNILIAGRNAATIFVGRVRIEGGTYVLYRQIRT